jgi:hypothetical protein
MSDEASKKSISTSKTANTISSLRDRDQDTFGFRIEFIKELLGGKELKPLINFDVTDTESFMNNKHNEKLDDSANSHDTRFSLNKKLHDFNSIITQIGGKLLYYKSGSFGHTFKGVINSQSGDDINYGVKVVAYHKKEKYGDIHDNRRPENAELMMIRLLSYFVIKRQTPHIVLPIGTFDTSIKPFITLIEDEVIDDENTKYNEFITRYKKGEYHDNVSILLSEWANRGDLLDFMRKNYKKFKLVHWKVFFFQVISTLAVIQSKFPGFRHNDMKANNILVHKILKKKTKFTYRVVRCNYSVPNIGYHIKLWDFDFATIPGVVDNSKVTYDCDWNKSINVTPEQNRYYDMHYFFNTLIKRGFLEQFLTDDCVPAQAKEFVHRIVPNKYKNGRYVHKRGRILINDEYLTPDEVLKTDPFFAEYRMETRKSSVKQTKSNNVKSNSIKNKSKPVKSKKYGSRSEELEEIKLDDLLNSSN